MNVLIVGLGNMGRNHQAALHRQGHTTVTVDPQPHQNADHQQLYYLRGDQSFSDIDAAVVATSVDALAVTAARLLRRGIPTLIEKPIARTASQARLLADLQANTGVPALAGYLERHNPAVLALRDRLGTASLARIHTMRQGPAPPAGGESLADLGTHDLAVADLLDPAGLANRVILTGYADTKIRQLTVTTTAGTEHRVDYIARTLDGHRIPGPDPLEAQWHAFERQIHEGDPGSLYPAARWLETAHGTQHAAAIDDATWPTR